MIKSASAGYDKGNIVGITAPVTKRSIEKLRLDKTSVSFGEQYIEEKILMFHRHSLLTPKLIKQELELMNHMEDKRYRLK